MNVLVIAVVVPECGVHGPRSENALEQIVQHGLYSMHNAAESTRSTYDIQ